MEFLCSDDKIDMRQILEERFAARLSHATKETEHHVRPLFSQSPQHSHFPQRLLVSHIAHATRVQEYDVSFCFVRDALVAARDERMRDLLRITLVHLAAVSLDEKFRHEGVKIIHGHNAFVQDTTRISRIHTNFMQCYEIRDNSCNSCLKSPACLKRKMNRQQLESLVAAVCTRWRNYATRLNTRSTRHLGGHLTRLLGENKAGVRFTSCRGTVAVMGVRRTN